ncbi:MAG: hypothetical protein N2511_00540 [Thermodesulfovibrionales bacterium]|nr:hypothetical protein [Thermodesulfovibrionales bacterium]
MAKRLIDILRVFARELLEHGYDVDYALQEMNIIDLDFLALSEELQELESRNAIDGLELDTIRFILAYILINDTDLDIDMIYSFIFCGGRQIVWN